eukprot:CAMPEP_0114517202 /NCGR_PEP_ID=MMETSP0109-20121206/17762_1 /TAXON_ID=29199 /ORGANISM="Chlorarachnion reptans, Strain CCCM449" /LENGTH=1988 /DNA_ID=CAMNT_0001697695 /DNA_START=49 /DNA_END=6015 /DNA_ORIENTATION=-
MLLGKAGKEAVRRLHSLLKEALDAGEAEKERCHQLELEVDEYHSKLMQAEERLDTVSYQKVSGEAETLKRRVMELERANWEQRQQIQQGQYSQQRIHSLEACIKEMKETETNLTQQLRQMNEAKTQADATVARVMAENESAMKGKKDLQHLLENSNQDRIGLENKVRELDAEKSNLLQGVQQMKGTVEDLQRNNKELWDQIEAKEREAKLSFQTAKDMEQKVQYLTEQHSAISRKCEEKSEALSLAGKRVEAMERDMRELQKEAQSAKDEASAVKNEIDASRKEAKTAREEAEALRREAETAREEVSSARKEAESAKEEVKAARKEAENAKEEAEAAKDEAADAMAQADMTYEGTEKMRADMQEALKAAEAMQKEVSEAKDRAEAAQKEAQEIRGKLEDEKAQKNNLNEELERAKEDITKKDQELEDLKNSQMKLQESLDTLQDSKRTLDESQGALKAANDTIKELEAEKEALGNQLKEIKSSSVQVGELTDKHETVKKALEKVQAESEAAKTKISELESDNAKVKSELEVTKQEIETAREWAKSMGTKCKQFQAKVLHNQKKMVAAKQIISKLKAALEKQKGTMKAVDEAKNENEKIKQKFKEFKTAQEKTIETAVSSAQMKSEKFILELREELGKVKEECSQLKEQNAEKAMQQAQESSEKFLVALREELSKVKQNLEEKKAELQTKSDELSSGTLELEARNEKICSLEQTLKRLQDEHNEQKSKNESLSAELTTTKANSKDEMQKMKENLAEATNGQKALEAELDKLKAQLQSRSVANEEGDNNATEKIQALESKSKEQKDRVEELLVENASLQDKLKKSAQELSEVREATESLEEAKIGAEEELEMISAARDALQAQRAELERQLEEMTALKEDFASKYDASVKKTEETTESQVKPENGAGNGDESEAGKESLDSKVGELQKLIDEKSLEISEATKKNENVAKRNKKLKERVRELQTQLATMRHKVKDYEKKQNASKDSPESVANDGIDKNVRSDDTTTDASNKDNTALLERIEGLEKALREAKSNKDAAQNLLQKAEEKYNQCWKAQEALERDGLALEAENEKLRGKVSQLLAASNGSSTDNVSGEVAKDPVRVERYGSVMLSMMEGGATFKSDNFEAKPDSQKESEGDNVKNDSQTDSTIENKIRAPPVELSRQGSVMLTNMEAGDDGLLKEISESQAISQDRKAEDSSKRMRILVELLERRNKNMEKQLKAFREYNRSVHGGEEVFDTDEGDTEEKEMKEALVTERLKRRKSQVQLELMNRTLETLREKSEIDASSNTESIDARLESLKGAEEKVVKELEKELEVFKNRAKEAKEIAEETKNKLDKAYEKIKQVEEQTRSAAEETKVQKLESERLAKEAQEAKEALEQAKAKVVTKTKVRYKIPKATLAKLKSEGEKAVGFLRSWENYEKQRAVKDRERRAKEKKAKEEREEKQRKKEQEDAEAKQGFISRMMGKKVKVAHMPKSKAMVWDDVKKKYIIEGAEDDGEEESNDGMPHPPPMAESISRALKAAVQEASSVPQNEDENEDGAEEADASNGEANVKPAPAPAKKPPGMSPFAGRGLKGKFAMPGVGGFGGGPSKSSSSGANRRRALMPRMPGMPNNLPKPGGALVPKGRKPMMPTMSRMVPKTRAAKGNEGPSKVAPMKPISTLKSRPMARPLAPARPLVPGGKKLPPPNLGGMPAKAPADKLDAPNSKLDSSAADDTPKATPMPTQSKTKETPRTPTRADAKSVKDSETPGKVTNDKPTDIGRADQSGTGNKVDENDESEVEDEIGEVDMDDEMVRRLVEIIRRLKRKLKRLKEKLEWTKHELAGARKASTGIQSRPAINLGLSLEEKRTLQDKIQRYEAEIRNLTSKSEELEAKLNSKSDVPPGGGKIDAPQNEQKAGDSAETPGEMSPQLLAAIKRMQHAEARLAALQHNTLEREREHASRALVRGIMNKEITENSLVSMKLRLSRFSAAALAAMFAGMYAAASQAEGGGPL